MSPWFARHSRSRRSTASQTWTLAEVAQRSTSTRTFCSNRAEGDHSFEVVTEGESKGTLRPGSTGDTLRLVPGGKGRKLESGTLGGDAASQESAPRTKDWTPTVFVTGVVALYGLIGLAIYALVTGPLQGVLAWVGL